MPTQTTTSDYGESCSLDLKALSAEPALSIFAPRTWSTFSAIVASLPPLVHMDDKTHNREQRDKEGELTVPVLAISGFHLNRMMHLISHSIIRCRQNMDVVDGGHIVRG